METATRFDRMTFTYTYDNIVRVYVVGGEVVKDISIDAKAVEKAYEIEDLQNLIKDAKEWAIDQWHKARAAYLEEAQEQELADRIARNKGEN